MTKKGFTIILLTVWAITAAYAQVSAGSGAQPQPALTNIVEKVEAPSLSDMYCSGFIAPHVISDVQYVAGGWSTPNQTRFVRGEYIYLAGGGMTVGQRYSIVRPVVDPSYFEAYKGQKKQINQIGQPYSELGTVEITKIENTLAIAKVDFSCDPIVPGDVVVPYVEKPAPKFIAHSPLDRFVSPNGKLTGRILMGKDFDVFMGNNRKVYLNVGTDQGVQAGDYFRATRTYSASTKDDGDSPSFYAKPDEPTQKKPEWFIDKHLSELPRKTLGEMIVLTTTATSATAMITNSLEPVNIGDMVELMEVPPPPPPPPPPSMNPPTISCTVTPATVRVGESAAIKCQAESPDNRPLNFLYASDGGTVMPRNGSATLETRGAAPGVIAVTATVMDDRNLTASAVSRVSVEAAPPPPAASRTAGFDFRPRSAYVDNRAKAVLDDVALGLQREGNSSVQIVGFSAPGENAKFGAMRASNARTYLVKDKGIDENRIHLADGGQGGHKAEIWFVPAGAALPAVTPIAAPPMPKPVKPAVKKPAVKPVAKPAASPAAKPTATPATKPTQPPAKPSQKK